MRTNCSQRFVGKNVFSCRLLGHTKRHCPLFLRLLPALQSVHLFAPSFAMSFFVFRALQCVHLFAPPFLRHVLFRISCLTMSTTFHLLSVAEPVFKNVVFYRGSFLQNSSASSQHYSYFTHATTTFRTFHLLLLVFSCRKYLSSLFRNLFALATLKR